MLTVEMLPNGIIRVFDRQASWASLYNADGSPRGGVDTARARKALSVYLAGPMNKPLVIRGAR